jgi:acyl-homoserine lactone acylase PvdQ
LPLGQSGQILDRHAKDQLRRWAVVRDFALPFSEKAVAAATVSTLTFVPPR